MNTDHEWEKWGQQEPYFAVLTHHRFRKANMSEEDRKAFFESGKDEINRVIQFCRRHLDADFQPERALDFGCGVGRLIIPLTEIAEEVVGLDVSESMVREAEQNCQRFDVKNVNLILSNDDLSQLSGTFDFIHSYIVFQHIPVERGRRILEKLLTHLNEGGIAAVHFTYAKTCFQTYDGFPPDIASATSGHSGSDPEMQMNSYNMSQLLFLIQSAGIENIHLELTNHGGDFGAYICFQKPGELT